MTVQAERGADRSTDSFRACMKKDLVEEGAEHGIMLQPVNAGPRSLNWEKRSDC